MKLYSCGLSDRLSLMWMDGTTKPISLATWRRIERTFERSSPPDSSTRGMRPYPISRASALTSMNDSMRGSSFAGAAGAAAASAVSDVAWRAYARAASVAAIRRRGRCGSPGTTPRTPRIPPDVASAFGFRMTWSAMSFPMSVEEPVRVTTMPAAVEMSSAGICATSPSPIVRTVKVFAASAAGIPIWKTPMMKPPTMLMPVIAMPATASPRTNLLAPSIAP